MKHLDDKDAESGKQSPAESSDPPDSSAFGRFEEFARKVISVPRATIEERERVYQESRHKPKPEKA